MRDEGPPAPFDLALNGRGFMLGVGQDGSALYREEWRSTTEPVERTKAWTGFPGGMGVPSEAQAGPEAAEYAYYLDCDTATGAETVGGGLDIRFGPPFKGPLVQAPVPVTPASSDHVVRRLCKWDGQYYAAIGTDLWRADAPDFTGTVTWLRTFEGLVRDLCPFAGQGGPSELNIAVDNGPRYVYDGTTFTADGGDSPRAAAVTSFIKAVGGTLTDYTAAVSDANPATGADLSALPTGTGRVLVGQLSPFGAVALTIPTANTVACTVGARYHDGTAWQPLTVTADATATAGVALAKSGTVAWTRPAGDWRPVILIPGAAGFYYVELTWTASLAAAVSVSEARTDYRLEADGFAVVNERLVMSTHGQRWWWTDQGSARNAWQSGVAYASPAADAVAVFTARGGVYIHKTDGLYTVDRDGLPAQVATYDPPLVSRDETPHAVWLDQAYLAMGTGSLIQVSPNPGGVAALEPVGPERLNLEQAPAQLVRVTAVAGDRTHFLYAAVELPDGASVLAAWGVYRQQRDRDGVLKWVRHDAWSVIAHLRQRCVTSMATWVAADGGNWLVMGDDAGTLLATRLAAGVSPLGDPDYRYTTVDGVLSSASFMGDDPGRPLVAYGAGLLARGLDAPAVTVRVQTVDAVTDPLHTVGEVTFTTSGRLPFPAGLEATARALRMRLVLHTADPTVTPIVDRVELFYQGLIRAEQATITATVLADDDVTDHTGQLVEWAAGDWQRELNLALRNVRASDGHLAPLVMIGTDGEQRTVLVQGRRDDQARRRETRSPARAVTLTLVTANGGGS